MDDKDEKKDVLLNMVKERLQKQSYYGDYFTKETNSMDEGVEYLKLINELREEGFLIRDSDLLIHLTDEGRKLIKNGGYVAMINENKRQVELKRKQEETIEFNHIIAKRNKENYVSDKWKFWIPLIISAGALFFTGGNFYNNAVKISDVSNRLDSVIKSKPFVQYKVDTLVVSKNVIDTTAK
jgi:hypothetical protein